MPVFSIITVVYNAEALLRGTAQSVFGQTFTDFEYIVVDGASTDGTPALLARMERSAGNQLVWSSEPDKGLYDAMNKGLLRAKGDFVWFLNAGDHLHAPDTLERISGMITASTDVLYGDTMLVDGSRAPMGLMSALSTRSLPSALTWRDYLYGMRVVHQSFVARRSIAPAYRTDSLVADYDWCIRILKASRAIRNTGMVLSDYLAGGLSKKRHLRSLADRFKVMRAHFGLLRTLGAHAMMVLRAVGHRLHRLGKPRY